MDGGSLLGFRPELFTAYYSLYTEYMPGTGKSEVFFVAAMMILILILSITAVYVFFKTYKKEMRDKEERKQAETRPVESVSEISNDESQI